MTTAEPQPPVDWLRMLVCPFDRGDLSRAGDGSLRCPSGHRFSTEGGIADLTVVEDRESHLHHRPQRRLEGITDYEDNLRAPSPSPRCSRLRHGIASVTAAARSARFFATKVRSASASFAREGPDSAPPPPSDPVFAFYPGGYTQALTKRLEKEVFWKAVDFTDPACEIGVHTGQASAYLFGEREIAFGSDYVPSSLRKGSFRHPVLFSANVKYLPFRDSSLGTVLSSQTIPCIHASIISVLGEINRVLRPGGRLAFTAHGPAFWWWLPHGGWPEVGLSRVECARRIEERVSYMSHLYGLDEWRQILEACGFEIALSRGLLSLDLARYAQLFYVEENAGRSIFAERCKKGLFGAVVRTMLLGRRALENCERDFAGMMQRILAHELSEHSADEFDDRRFLDAGILAIKTRELAGRVSRLQPRPPR